MARSVIVLETGLCLGSADFRHRDLSVLSPDLDLGFEYCPGLSTEFSNL